MATKPTKKPTKTTTKPKTVTVKIMVGIDTDGMVWIPGQQLPARKRDEEWALREILDDQKTPACVEVTLTVPKPIVPETVKGQETAAPKPKKRKPVRPMPLGGWD